MSRVIRSLLPLVAAVALFGPSDAEAAGRKGPPRTALPVEGVVNLNTATEAQLLVLPGVGPAKARQIVEQRKHAKFTSTDQIMKVKGIGKKTYRKLKPYLAVSGETTLRKVRDGKKPAKKAAKAPPREEVEEDEEVPPPAEEAALPRLDGSALQCLRAPAAATAEG